MSFLIFWSKNIRTYKVHIKLLLYVLQCVWTYSFLEIHIKGEIRTISFKSCQLVNLYKLLDAYYLDITKIIATVAITFFIAFLAHLRTKCSRWAFVMVRCQSSVRACVRASIISLNNFSSETTFGFWPNFIGMISGWSFFKSCSNHHNWLHK